jgi:CHAD domain-containing protein
VLEIERKYDAGSGLVVPDLADLAGVTSVSDPESQVLSATYVDTPDRTLLDSGITLRRRTGGADAGWHLKLPAAEAPEQRHELQLPLGRAGAAVPRRFQELLQTVVGDRGLAPVATVTTRRTRRCLLDAQGRVLAELVDDRVEGARVDAEDTVTWRELEVELGAGDPVLLDRTERRLLAAGAQVAQHSTKLARVLGRPEDLVAAPLLPHDPVARLVQRRLAEQLHQLVLRDPLARADLPEGVHAMRVATRRLRSVLATGRPFLDQSVTEPLRDEIAWIAGVLGRARDTEVMRERLDEAVDAVVADRLLPPADAAAVRRALLEPLTRQHRRAVADLNLALRSDRYAALVGDLREVTAGPPFTPRADQTIRDAYRRRAGHELRRFQQLSLVASVIDGEADPEARSVALHAARRAAKRARYAVEPLREVYGRPAENLVDSLKAVQTALGRRQDTVVTRDYLIGLTDERRRRPLDPEAALVAGVIVERERLDALLHEEEAADAVRRVARSRLLRR